MTKAKDREPASPVHLLHSQEQSYFFFLKSSTENFGVFLLFIFKYSWVSAVLQLLAAQFWAPFRKRKTIARNHPETDSLFYDLAF